MSIGLVFWICMLIWAVFGIFTNRAVFGSGNYAGLGGSVLEFVLFFLLGWGVFGPPIHG